MSVPNFQKLMLPLLLALQDGQVRTVRETNQFIADHFKLTQEDREALMPNKHQSVLAYRTAWAKTYLKNAGLVINPARGQVAISKAGLDLLKTKPTKIDARFLYRYPSFLRFKDASRRDSPLPVQT